MKLASKTGQVNYKQKGEPGQKGDRGPALRGPMEWDSQPEGFPFQSGAEGEDFIDIVLYNNAYYQCITSHTKTTGNHPESNYGYWSTASQLGFVATKILLATYALVKNLGVEAIEMKDAAGNILFQAKDGNVTCNTGTFKNIKVQSGQIASFVISGQQMQAESVGGQSMLLSPSLIRFLADAVQVYLGSNTVPDYASMDCPLRVQMTGGDGMEGTANTGLYIDVSGAGDDGKDTAAYLGNHALYVPNGDFAGLRPKLRRVDSSQTLSKMDYYVIGANTGTITLTLPADCEDGQTYWIVSANGARINIALPAGDTFVNGGSYIDSTSWHTYIYDRHNKKWIHAWLNRS